MRARRLMIFAKAPIPGQVKTRLAGGPEGIGEAWATELHGAFVTDVVARLAPLATTTVWRAGASEHPLWGALAARHPALGWRDQGAGDLGARMRRAFEETLAAGEPVVIVGTDSPTLPPTYVAQAFEALADTPVVIGPACDGGYYLLGLSQVPEGIFEGVPWGTGDVCAETMARLDAAGVPYTLLPFWYDVDRPSDLRLLRRHLAPLARDGEIPKATAAAIEAMEIAAMEEEP